LTENESAKEFGHYHRPKRESCENLSKIQEKSAIFEQRIGQETDEEIAETRRSGAT